MSYYKFYIFHHNKYIYLILQSFVFQQIKGAKQVHNLQIDYVGIWNERPYDVKYIKVLRKVLDENNLQ